MARELPAADIPGSTNYIMLTKDTQRYEVHVNNECKAKVNTYSKAVNTAEFWKLKYPNATVQVLIIKIELARIKVRK